MQIIYYDNETPKTITKSIFLAGCSTRPGQNIDSWRKDAIKILEDIGYTGTVFVPENKDGCFDENYNYEEIIQWEEKHLNLCDCIMFWMPRKMDSLPGMTSNVEFGRYEQSPKLVLGYPKDAEKMRYLQYYADKYNVPIAHTLTDTIYNTLDKLGEGAERSDGEVYVPLFIWNTPSFQSWYTAQTEAGNILEHAELFYSYRPNYKDFVFLWILEVSIYVTAEKRNKKNEFVLSRPDIASVLLWKKEDKLEDSQIVIIREFRPAASTPDGFIRELTGGSSWDPNDDPIEIAAHEVHEETGFFLKPSRLKFHKARQLMGTLSSHKSFLYSAEVTEEELKWFKSQDGIAHGVKKDTERTYIEIATVGDLITSDSLDWSSLGQVLSVIYE